MVEGQEKITVEDIRKLALPIGTHVVAGEGLLSRPVAWFSVIYALNGNLPTLNQPGEIVLVAPPDSGTMPYSDLALIRWATDQSVAALVMSHMPVANAISEANAYGLPLLVLPHNSAIRVVEKAVVSLMVDRGGQIERRGIQIYRQLTEISARNEGIGELVNTISRLTGKTVVIQDKRLRPIHTTVHPGLVAHWDEIETHLRKLSSLPAEMQDRMRVSELRNPVMLESLPIPTIVRLICPIITKDIGRGYLSIIGHENDFDDIDTLVAEHGAAACALEMAKAKAISETEKRLRGTFLDRLLIGDVSQQEAIRQGERFDHDMNLPHIAIVLSWQSEKPPSIRRLETLVNSVVAQKRAKALIWQREKEQEVLVFHTTEAENPIDKSLELALAFSHEVEVQHSQAKVAIGVGQPALDVANWRISYRDAVQALDLARRLQTNTPLYIGDLGVYQLLLGLSDREKLVSFCDQTLGKLVEYDRGQRSDLLKTLEAFFACHGNLSQTAEVLIVHRNTLLYRMARINQIAGVDLERPETRLSLHLALTIRRLLMLN